MENLAKKICDKASNKFEDFYEGDGYSTATREAVKAGGKLIYNSNNVEVLQSFAPTLVYEFEDGSFLRVDRKGCRASFEKRDVFAEELLEILKNKELRSVSNSHTCDFCGRLINDFLNAKRHKPTGIVLCPECYKLGFFSLF